MPASDLDPFPQPTGHQLLVFLVQLGVLLALALVLGRAATRVGLPSVVGELLSGLLIGPSVLGNLAPELWRWVFPAEASQANMINAVAQLGVILLVGVTGMHFDLDAVRRRGPTAVRVSLGGLLVPLAAGVALGWVLPQTLLGPAGDRTGFALFLGVAMSVSAIPVIAKTLMDLNLLHRRIGQLTLTAGAVDDAIAWCLLSFVSTFAVSGAGGWSALVTAAELAAVLVCAVLAGPLVRMTFTAVGRGGRAGPVLATATLMIVAGAATTQALGLEPTFGALVVGMLLGSRQVRAVVGPAPMTSLQTFTLAVVAPVFLATAGLRMDLAPLTDPTVLLVALLVLLVAVAGKFAGAYLGARLSRLSRRDGLALGAGMNARGVVEVVIAMVGLQLGILTSTTYTIVVLLALVTSLMAGPLLRLVMSGQTEPDPDGSNSREDVSAARRGAVFVNRTGDRMPHDDSGRDAVNAITPTQICLTDEEQDAIRKLAEELTTYDPVTGSEEYITAAQLQSARIPERIRLAALTFRRAGDRSGGLLIRNLPVDPLPPTPDHADDALGIRLPAARVFSLMSALFGDQFGFRPELAGHVIQDILPVRGFEDTQQSISSRALLELHCETVFTEFRADFIGLLCLRPDPDRMARTVLSPTAAILPLLDPDVRRILQEPRFSTTVDGSFLRGSGIEHPIVTGPIRVLDGDPGRPRIRCDFAETRGLDAQAQDALDTLYRVASQTLIDVRLEAGDMLLIDNHDAFHGRSSFRRHGNGADRWLLRTFITRDLCRSRVHRPGDGRIVDTDYAAGENVMAFTRAAA